MSDMATATDTEAHRRACEARGWIRRGYVTPKDVRALRGRIAAKRGDAAAEQLVQDMREEWRRQRDEARGDEK